MDCLFVMVLKLNSFNLSALPWALSIGLLVVLTFNKDNDFLFPRVLNGNVLNSLVSLIVVTNRFSTGSNYYKTILKSLKIST